MQIFYSSDPKELRTSIAGFYLRLKQANVLAIYWLSLILERTEKLTIKRKRIIKAQELISMIMELFLPVKLYSRFYNAWKHFSEKRPFFMLAVLAILYDFQQVNDNNLTWDMLPIIRKQEIELLLTGQYQFLIPDIVKDKHTKSGKKLNRNRDFFVNESALVVNQHPYFYNDVLAEIYSFHRD